MDRKILRLALVIAVSLFVGTVFTGCNDGEDASEPYLLKKEDIRVSQPEGGFAVVVDQLLKVRVESESDEGISYLWLLDGSEIARTKDLEYMFEEVGEYELILRASQGENHYDYLFTVTVAFDNIEPAPEGATAYITKVLDFVPAVGQFTNALPAYDEGDTQEVMNEKVLAAIGNNKKGMISLGGFGGYVVVGFDHTITNVTGKRDFRVLGNAFYSAANPDSDAPEGGSCEPGVIMVAYDKNQNGMPDEDEWYEIAGSDYYHANTCRGYEITYYRPDENKQPVPSGNMSITDAEYIRWTDNLGESGFLPKLSFHRQSYFPQWISDETLTFKGTRLPDNGINESDNPDQPYYVLHPFDWGYADNHPNTSDRSCIRIDWAVDTDGNPVELPGVDFIKVYTGVNQVNGWVGECSTEIIGITDLHAAASLPAVGTGESATAYLNRQTGRLHLFLPQAMPVSLFNASGRLLLSYRLGQGQQTLDLSELSDGVYVLRAGQQSFKLIK